MSTDTFVGLTEAATRAGVSPRTIRRYIAAGHLPAYRLGPRLIRVAVADLDALVRPVAIAGGQP